MTPVDGYALAASILAGLAAFVLALAVAPGLLHRRAVAVRLERFVGPAAPVRARRAPRLDARRALARRRWWRRLATRVHDTWDAWASERLLVLAAILVAAAAAYALTRDPLLTIAGGLQVVIFSVLRGRDLRDKRTRLLDEQTLPTIMRLAAALRAGASLVQAMQAVARDAPAPTSEEFDRALDEVAIGFSVDDALVGLAERAGTPDYQALAVALNVQRRVGGNLAAVLDTLAESTRERIDLRQEIAVLTAQQRFQSWVLAGLPYAITAALFVLDRSYLEPLISTGPGRLILFAASVLLAVGSIGLRLAGRVSL